MNIYGYSLFAMLIQSSEKNLTKKTLYNKGKLLLKLENSPISVSLINNVNKLTQLSFL